MECLSEPLGLSFREVKTSSDALYNAKIVVEEELKQKPSVENQEKLNLYTRSHQEYLEEEQRS